MFVLATAVAFQDDLCQRGATESAGSSSSSLLQASTVRNRAKPYPTEPIPYPPAENATQLLATDQGGDDVDAHLVEWSSRSQSQSNLCIDIPGDGEYFAPEFMLIGAEKAATSSFMLMFQTAGVIFPSNFNDSVLAPHAVPKELHIFDVDDRFESGKAFWLHHFPKCSRGVRMVATDFTPSYLYHWVAPERIRASYAEQSSKVKFGVIMRDPLLRAHSSFHYWKRGVGRYLCDREFIEVEFSAYVKGHLLNGGDPCGLMKAGDYSVLLERYFKEFNASQFTIFPFKQLTQPARNDSTAFRDLWHSLGLAGDAEEPEPVRGNDQPHPSLQDDLDADTLSALEAHIAETMPVSKLATLLSASEQKPTLAGYKGDLYQESIAAWLQENW